VTARLRRKQPGVKGVESVLEREVEKALEALDGPWPPADGTVHDVRKRLKKARAALRLERAALGGEVYRRENRTLRDASRPLSAVRDAAVLIDTLDRLGLDGEVEGLRDALRAERSRTRTRVLADGRRLRPVVANLRRARGRLARVRLARHGWNVLGRGVRRTYRNGRRAYALAREHPTAENLHEWRKQAKYLWQVLEFLQPVAPRRLERLARRTHRLSDQLGKDHDLVVLGRSKAALTAVPLALREAAQRRIDARRATLLKRAMVLGAVVYKDRPRTLERRLRRRWRAWRSA
jgi:CHAD domain-containing protein